MAKFYMTGPAWETIITNNRFEVVEEMDISLLREINEKRALIFKVNNPRQEKIPYDAHQWSYYNKLDNIRHQPSYQKLWVFGESVDQIRCTDYHNFGFKKEVIHTKGECYVYYFLLGDASYSVPDNEMIRKRRLGAHDAVKVQDLLRHRKSTKAYDLGPTSGLPYDKRQYQNQMKYVPEAIVGKSGPKIKTTMADMQTLKDTNGHLDYLVDPSGELRYQYVNINEDIMKMYCSLCPQKEELDEWRKKVEEIRDISVDERLEKLKEMLTGRDDSLIFPSRLFVDTTYNLADSYVTFLLGEISSFITKESQKPRVVMIGYMLHTKRDQEAHNYFASKLKEIFDRHRGTRSIPCLLLDGERTLEVYAEQLETVPVRCDYHILSLLTHKFHKGPSTAAKKYIFGTNHNGTWKCGLLGVFTLSEYEKKLDLLKSEIDSNIWQWLYKNRSMIVESASLLAKLNAGHILQYSTNNPSENLNKQLKHVFGKATSAVNLHFELSSFSEAKLHELWLACLGTSQNVSLNEEISALDQKRKIEKLQEIGIPCITLLGWSIPESITRSLNIGMCKKNCSAVDTIDCITSTKNLYVLEDTSVPVGNRERVATVQRLEDFLECSLCKQTLPDYLCKHLIACLKPLDAPIIREELFRISIKLKPTSKPFIPARAGKKLSDRLGERFSAKNHKRVIRRVTHLTIFEEPTTDDESILNETLRDHELSMVDRSPMIRSFAEQNVPHESITDLSFDSDGVSREAVQIIPSDQEEHATSSLQEENLNDFLSNPTNESSITFAHPLASSTAVESVDSDSSNDVSVNTPKQTRYERVKEIRAKFRKDVYGSDSDDDEESNKVNNSTLRRSARVAKRRTLE